MLTKEILKAVPALKDLSEEALNAITTLSMNDENAVIAQKTADIHNAYDKDVKELTGKDKPGGVKTYDHVKSVIKEYMEAAQSGTKTLQDKIDSLAREKSDLEKKIKENAGDKALAEKLETVEKDIADKENRIKALQKQLEDEKNGAKAGLEKAQAEMIGLQFDFEFQRGLTGAKFKDEKIIPKDVRETFIQTAMSAIKGKYKMDFLEDKDGKKKIPVFRDAQGMIVNNPKNLQNPYTPAEMLLDEIQSLLVDGKSQAGGGSKPGEGGSSGSFVPTDFKNRVEATDGLRKHLASQGLVYGTEKFQEAFNKEWTEANLSALPVK